VKNRENLIAAILLGLLFTTLMLPLTTAITHADNDENETPATWRVTPRWTIIQNDIITIIFPTGGKKPMFLWWNTQQNDTINVVKFKGLIEYVTYEQEYFMWRSQADGLRMREHMEEHYYMPRIGMMQNHMRENATHILDEIDDLDDIQDLGLHRPYLPFSGARWELSQPMNVTKGEVKYLSFNFTLKEVPDGWQNMQFAENNIILRFRFYYTPATEDVEGRYTYTVDAGELKMDLIIKHWEWNIDNPNLQALLQLFQNMLGVTIPQGKTGLALWVNLASINMTQIPIAEDDAETPMDTDYTERESMARNMYVEGEMHSVMENRSMMEDERPMQNRMRERNMFRFERGNATLAGFFKFVPKALLRNATDNTVVDVVDVAASYISAGAHMRVFIGYPYFGDYTLEHDPSLGLETLPTLATYELIIALLGITTIIAIGILAIRWKKGSVNILKTN